jgi:hypothetical protein
MPHAVACQDVIHLPLRFGDGGGTRQGQIPGAFWRPQSEQNCKGRPFTVMFLQVMALSSFLGLFIAFHPLLPLLRYSLVLERTEFVTQGTHIGVRHIHSIGKEVECFGVLQGGVSALQERVQFIIRKWVGHVIHSFHSIWEIPIFIH